MTDDSDGLPDLPEIPPTQQMQDLLSAYRDQTHRSSAQVESALQSVTAQVGTAGATAATAGLSTTAKAGLVAALLGVVGVIGLAVAGPDPQPEPRVTQVEPVAMSAPTAPPVVEADREFAQPETSPVPEPLPEEDTAAAQPPPPKARTKAKAKPRAKPEAMPTKAAPADTLADELRALQQARAALRAGTPARARSLIKAHRRDYPNSTLARERDATEVAALCAEDRDADAKRKAAAFAKAYPGSSQDLLADCDG